MMTWEQLKKYRFHVGEWKKARAARGLPCDDEARYALHKRAIGRICSSTEFTNSELDAVLGKLQGEANPADFDAQMEQQESPDRRKALFLERCYHAAWEIYNQGGNNGLAKGDRRTSYVAGTVRNVTKKTVEECSAEEIARALGVLNAHVERLKSKNEARIAEARGLPAPATRPTEDEEPF